MAPTTESPEARIFHLLRKDGLQVDLTADTICDENGYGISFRFKRGGKAVGQAQGEFDAWWLEPPSDAAKIYYIEIQKGAIIRIAADSVVVVDDPRRRRVFKIGDNITGTVYEDYATWWIEDNDPA